MHWGSVGDSGSELFAREFAKYSVASGGLAVKLLSTLGPVRGLGSKVFGGNLLSTEGPVLRSRLRQFPAQALTPRH